jgi:hypothetical protein
VSEFQLRARATNARAIFERSSSTFEDVTFPVGNAELRELAAKFEIADIGDFGLLGYETGFDMLDRLLPSGANFAEVNYLACKLSEMDVETLRKYVAVAETLSTSSQRCRTFADFINLADSLHNFGILPHTSPEQYGQAMLDDADNGMFAAWKELRESVNSNDHEFAEFMSYLFAAVTPEALGEVIADIENGVFTEYGYVTQLVYAPIREDYHSKSDIPAEYRLSLEPTEIIGLTAISAVDAKALTADGNATVYVQDGEHLRRLQPLEAMNDRIWTDGNRFLFDRSDVQKLDELRLQRSEAEHSAHKIHNEER